MKSHILPQILGEVSYSSLHVKIKLAIKALAMYVCRLFTTLIGVFFLKYTSETGWAVHAYFLRG